MTEEQRQKKNAQQRERYKSEEVKAKRKAYRESHAEERKAYMKQWHEEHREKSLEYMKEYRKQNLDAINARQKKYREDNKELVSEQRKRRYQANRELYIARVKAYQMEHREETLAKKRARETFKRYGLTQEQIDAMIESQGNRCKCCNTAFGLLRGHRPNVDHCHRTGRIRGILCGQCNLLLGHANDKPKVLKSCAKYLRDIAKEESQQIPDPDTGESMYA